MTPLQGSEWGQFVQVGVVGCGHTGAAICRAIDDGTVHAVLGAICDTDASKAERLVMGLKRPTRSMSLRGLVASVDLVIEATNRHVAPEIIMTALAGGKGVLVTSVGALLARHDFPRLAQDHDLTIFAVNLLLAGGTALNTAQLTPGATITLTLNCTPDVIGDAPFMRARKLDLAAGPQLVFQGAPVDAMAAFPALSSLVACAAIGAGAAEALIRVFAHDVPETTELELRVTSGRQTAVSAVSVPSFGKDPVHPDTVALAAIGALRSATSSLRLV